MALGGSANFDVKKRMCFCIFIFCPRGFDCVRVSRNPLGQHRRSVALGGAHHSEPRRVTSGWQGSHHSGRRRATSGRQGCPPEPRRVTLGWAEPHHSEPRRATSGWAEPHHSEPRRATSGCRGSHHSLTSRRIFGSMLPVNRDTPCRDGGGGGRGGGARAWGGLPGHKNNGGPKSRGNPAAQTYGKTALKI